MTATQYIDVRLTAKEFNAVIVALRPLSVIRLGEANPLCYEDALDWMDGDSTALIAARRAIDKFLATKRAVGA